MIYLQADLNSFFLSLLIAKDLRDQHRVRCKEPVISLRLPRHRIDNPVRGRNTSDRYRALHKVLMCGALWGLLDSSKWGVWDRPISKSWSRSKSWQLAPPPFHSQPTISPSSRERGSAVSFRPIE